MKIILGDIQSDLCAAWRSAFRGLRHVEVHEGDFFDIDADAYVSPANSHGIMDGGFDHLLRIRFPGVDVRVQRAIDELGGLLPLGHAVVVETLDYDVPYLISAPTMVLPGSIAESHHVELAMKAVLRAVTSFNERDSAAIEIVAIPGLGTGVGRVPPMIAARHMRAGYDAHLEEQG